jgi:ABC-2 type transport system permease protein
MSATQTTLAPPAEGWALREAGPWWSRFAKYGAVLRTSVANNLAYWNEVLLRCIFLVLVVFIFVQLWHLTYSVLGTTTVGGFTIAQMVWYFAFAEAIVLSTPQVRGKIDNEVKTGGLAYQLNKPYHYVLYLGAEAAGERLVRFSLNMVVGIALALLFVGPIPFSLAGLAGAALLVVGAFVLDFMMLVLVGLLAFWVEDTSSFNLIYSRLVMLLGGMMIPLNVFPEPLASIARALPFSYLIYGPSRMWVSPSPDFFVEMALKLLIALLVAGTVLALAYRAGLKNVTVNGG